MGKETYYNKMIELILSYLTENLTETQQTELNTWREQNKEHEKLFQKIITIENFERYIQRYKEHDYRPRWNEFKRTIHHQKKIRLIRYASYAASILLLLAVSLYLFYPEKTMKLSSKEVAILPGSSRAILKMANGKQINLEKPDPDFNHQYSNIVLHQDRLEYVRNDTISLSKTEIHTLTIPRGGEYFMILSDGTKVWLNSETELAYPTHFTAKERKVKLSGEAYFEVMGDTSRPFIVISGEQTLQVLGTSFAVKAYADDDQTTTTLVSGLISIGNGRENKLLHPGQQSQVNRDYIKVKEVNTELYTAWHKGLFVFIDQPLDEILTILGRWYNIHIFYTNEKLKQIRFTGEIPRYAQVTELLKKIEQLEKVRFTIKDKTVTVTTYR